MLQKLGSNPIKYLIFFMILSTSTAFAAPSEPIQAMTLQDSDGNIEFRFNNVSSIRIAPSSTHASGESCSTKEVSEGAIRYNRTIKSLEYCDGTSWISVASGGGLKSIQSFATSGTWVKPSGIRHILIKTVGGGGGGGSRDLYFHPPGSDESTRIGPMGAGGGAGGYCEKVVDVTAIETLPVWVGAGGIGVPSGTGGTGGTSQMGNYCTAFGGAGGSGRGYGGDGGGASNGDINTAGARGENSYVYYFGGNGANGPWGGAGIGQSAVTSGPTGASIYTPATSGTAPGSGGGGSAPELGVGNSGSGAAGIVIVYEYE